MFTVFLSPMHRSCSDVMMTNKTQTDNKSQRSSVNHTQQLSRCTCSMIPATSASIFQNKDYVDADLKLAASSCSGWLCPLSWVEFTNGCCQTTCGFDQNFLSRMESVLLRGSRHSVSLPTRLSRWHRHTPGLNKQTETSLDVVREHLPSWCFTQVGRWAKDCWSSFSEYTLSAVDELYRDNDPFRPHCTVCHARILINV